MKWGGSNSQCLSNKLDVQALRMGIKLDHEICILGGHLMDAKDFASLSANSLPAIPA